MVGPEVSRIPLNWPLYKLKAANENIMLLIYNFNWPFDPPLTVGGLT